MQPVRVFRPSIRLALQNSSPWHRPFQTASHVQSRRSYSRLQKEKAPFDHSRIPNQPLFEVPLAVLDLDAENNPHVRNYSAQDHDEQVKLWSQDQELGDLIGRMKNFQGSLQAKESLWFDKLAEFDRRTITERDVLQLAFLGSPKPDDAAQVQESMEEEVADGEFSQQEKANILLSREILYAIGVSDAIIDDSRQLIHVLLRRLRIQQQQTQQQAGKVDDKKPKPVINANVKEEFGKAVKNADFLTMRRVAAPLLRAHEGLHAVDSIRSHLEEACNASNPNFSEEYRAQATAFLNNVSINLTTRHTQPLAQGRPH